MAKRFSIQGKGADIFFGELAGDEPQPAIATGSSEIAAASDPARPPQPSPRPRIPASSSGGTSAPPGEPSGERVRARAGEPSRERPGSRIPARTSPRAGEPTRTRRFSRQGRAADGVVRHSHDLFRDQILWLNRLKLDLEVEYGQRVNGNDIVQLAMDLLRDEYEVLAEQSNLVQVLVFGQPRSTRRRQPARAEGGGDRPTGP